MIYLIKTAVFVPGEKERNDKSVLAYKIGYSDDSREQGRFNDYKCNGFTFRVIKTVPGGTEELEHQLQKKFSKYRIPTRSVEWFFVNKEILDAFKSFETEDDICEFLGFLDMDDFLSEKAPHKKRELGIDESLIDYYVRLTRKQNQDDMILDVLRTLDGCRCSYEQAILLCELEESKYENNLDDFKKLLSLFPESLVHVYYKVREPKCFREAMKRSIEDVWKRSIEDMWPQTPEEGSK